MEKLLSELEKLHDFFEKFDVYYMLSENSLKELYSLPPGRDRMRYTLAKLTKLRMRKYLPPGYYEL